jgi:NTE family protein
VSWLATAVERVRSFAYAPRRFRRRAGAPARPKIGLALGGGFARGIAHIGILRALQQNGIPIDCIAGTSVGALIATMYAAGTPLDVMEKQAAETSFSDFGKWTVSWLGFASNARLGDYLHRANPVQQFSELKIPLSIVATDLGSGDPVYFTQGEVVPPLRASCAYPGLFLPVEYQGRVLVDGFLASPVPVAAVQQLGADIVIAVYLDSASNDERPENLIGVVGRSFAIMQRHANKLWRKTADVVVEPEVAQFAWDDFSRTPDLLHAGEAAATAAVPQIRALLQLSSEASSATAAD